MAEIICMLVFVYIVEKTSMYRIVHNEQTDTYRVEKRGVLGWAFVSNPQTGDYLGFDDVSEARNWIRSNTRRDDQHGRRWKVVSECNF